MKRIYFQPLAGKKYLNRNGTTYFCLEPGKEECSALFISLTSGYTLLAHECQKNDDGTIEWNRSEGRGFKDVQQTIEKYDFDSDLIVFHTNS